MCNFRCRVGVFLVPSFIVGVLGLIPESIMMAAWGRGGRSALTSADSFHTQPMEFRSAIVVRNED